MEQPAPAVALEALQPFPVPRNTPQQNRLHACDSARTARAGGGRHESDHAAQATDRSGRQGAAGAGLGMGAHAGGEWGPHLDAALLEHAGDDLVADVGGRRHVCGVRARHDQRVLRLAGIRVVGVHELAARDEAVGDADAEHRGREADAEELRAVAYRRRRALRDAPCWEACTAHSGWQDAVLESAQLWCAGM